MPGVMSLIEHYENISKPETQGWLDTTIGTTVYSSLVGVPMSNVNDFKVERGIAVNNIVCHLLISYQLSIRALYLLLDFPKPSVTYVCTALLAISLPPRA
jgi:hypothetical protein